MDDKKEEKKAEAGANEDVTVEEEAESGLPAEQIKKLREKLAQCHKEKEEYLAGWQRAKADFINARKDEEKKYAEYIRYSNQALIHDILTVLDSFELAFQDYENKQAEEMEKTMKGFRLIKSQLDNILKQYGLKTIKSVGEKFNPELHESVAEAVSEKESGTVIEEFQKGYLLNDKVLRPAKVKIAK